MKKYEQVILKIAFLGAENNKEIKEKGEMGFKVVSTITKESNTGSHPYFYVIMEREL